MGCLFLDGISQKVREIGIENKARLCAFGFHHERPGEPQRLKEILSFQLSRIEDEAFWKEFLTELIR